MIEINLVPDVKQELLRAQRIRSTVIAVAVIVGMISVGSVVALSIYIYGFQNIRGGLADRDITTKSKELMDVSDLSKTLTIQNQLTKISSLSDSKKINSRLFDMLNAIIPPEPNDIKVSDMSIDSSASTITINGQAENSYAAVEVFKKTISGANVKFTDSDNKEQKITLASNISTRDASYGLDSTGKKVLRFTMSFNYASELFSPLQKNVSVVIGNNGNATDSYLGVPRDIFTNKATDIKEGN